MGHVTRCVHSPRLEKNIGFANVAVGAAGVGTALDIDAPGERRTAQIVPFPFVESQRSISR